MLFFVEVKFLFHPQLENDFSPGEYFIIPAFDAFRNNNSVSALQGTTSESVIFLMISRS